MATREIGLGTVARVGAKISFLILEKHPGVCWLFAEYNSSLREVEVKGWAAAGKPEAHLFPRSWFFGCF